MKKIAFLRASFLIALLITPMFCNALINHSAHTFMFTKPLTSNLSIEQAGWSNVLYKKQMKGAAFQAYGIFETSIINGPLQSYFLFDNKQELVVQYGADPGTSGPGVFPATTTPNPGVPGDYNDISGERDILAQWLGVTDTNFDQSYTFQPAQTQYGIAFDYNHDVKHFINMGSLQNLTAGVMMPLVYSQNSLNYSGSEELRSALNGVSEGQSFQLIPDAPISRFKAAFVMPYVATKYRNDHDIQVATKTFLILPISAPINNEYIFEPQLEYNGHAILGSQVAFQIPIFKKSEDSSARIALFIYLENKFPFENTQYRTFDLYYKPFSRYLKIYDNVLNQALPGVTALTRKCKVNPYNLINFMTGIRVFYHDSCAEFGYELWGHGQENVVIDSSNPWQNNRYGIALIEADGTPVLGATASTSTINFVGPQDTEPNALGTALVNSPVYIDQAHLNLNSAGAASAITHRLFASANVANRSSRLYTFLTLGGFIEVSQNNSALSKWGCWAKFGISF